MLKPSDFFVGIVDFFAVILPGVLLTFLITDSTWGIDSRIGDAVNSLSGVTRSFAFFVLAYIVGHMAAALSGPLDHVADWGAERWEPKHAKELEKFANRSMIERLNGSDSFSTQLGFIATYVRMHSAVAGAEIDRLQAVSRFFRSLVGVYLAILLIAPRAVEDVPLYMAIPGLVLVVWLFGYQRWKRRLAIYTGFVTLVCCPKPGQ